MTDSEKIELMKLAFQIVSARFDNSVELRGGRTHIFNSSPLACKFANHIQYSISS